MKLWFEDHIVIISRVCGTFTFTADFVLIGAINPYCCLRAPHLSTLKSAFSKVPTEGKTYIVYSPALSAIKPVKECACSLC